MKMKKDVHTEHCCALHGCKYDNQACPVENGLAPQSYPCEQCREEINEDEGWETAHLINHMITRERDAFVVEMWDLYLRACACHMDYGSLCECPGSEIAESELRRILGEDWHKICRERFAPKSTKKGL